MPRPRWFPKADLITFADLLVRASALTGLGRRCLLGIAGPPGSGKSTLAENIGNALGPQRCAVVSMDGFHIGDSVLRMSGLRDRKGAQETFDRAGFASVVARLKANEDTVYVPVFDRSREDSTAAALAIKQSVPLVIFEGNYLIAWPEIRKLITTIWYLDPPEKERIDSLIERHVAYGMTPTEAYAWVYRCDERNAAIVSQTRSHADLVVGNRV